MTKKRAGRVKLAGKPVGTIEEVGEDSRFTYSPDWLARKDAVPLETEAS